MPPKMIQASEHLLPATQLRLLLYRQDYLIVLLSGWQPWLISHPKPEQCAAERTGSPRGPLENRKHVRNEQGLLSPLYREAGNDAAENQKDAGVT